MERRRYREDECLLMSPDAHIRTDLNRMRSYTQPGGRVEKHCLVTEMPSGLRCLVTAIGAVGGKGYCFSESEYCMGYLPLASPRPDDDSWRAEYQAYLADQQQLEEG